MNKEREMLPFSIISNTNVIPKVSIQSWDVGNNSIGLVTASGDLYFTGDNTYGQFGNGTTTSPGAGIWIKSSMTGVQSVWMCKGYTTVILKKDGTAWYCGRIQSTSISLFGVSGQSSGTYSNWIQITSGLPVTANLIKQIFLCGYYTIIVTIDGLLYMSGVNSVGNFGNGTTNGTSAFTLIPFSQTTPVQKAIGTSNVTFNGSYACTTILTKDGRVFNAGNNYYLKCFNNFNYRSSNYTSFQDSGLTGIVDIDAEEQFYVSTTSDGGLWATGYAGNLMSGNSSMNTRFAASGYHKIVSTLYWAFSLNSTGTAGFGLGYSNGTPILNDNTAKTSFGVLANKGAPSGLPTDIKATSNKNIVLLYNTNGVVKIYAVGPIVGQGSISNAGFLQVPNPPF